MARTNVHVVPNGKGWAVKTEGAAKPLSRHKTQQTAAGAGKKVARANQSELVIHRSSGQIRDKGSYGNDPCPPKDTKRSR